MSVCVLYVYRYLQRPEESIIATGTRCLWGTRCRHWELNLGSPVSALYYWAIFWAPIRLIHRSIKYCGRRREITQQPVLVYEAAWCGRIRAWEEWGEKWRKRERFPEEAGDHWESLVSWGGVQLIQCSPSMNEVLQSAPRTRINWCRDRRIGSLTVILGEMGSWRPTSLCLRNKARFQFILTNHEIATKNCAQIHKDMGEEILSQVLWGPASQEKGVIDVEALLFIEMHTYIVLTK